MARAREVPIGWTGDDGEDFRVRCRVTPGVPEQRWGDGAHPAEPPEVEVLSVHEDRPGGAEREDLIPVVEAALGSIEHLALEQANENAAGEEEDAAEMRAESRREAGYRW